MAQQLLSKFDWTSTSVIIDLNPAVPFYNMAATYMARSIRQSTRQLRAQMFTFPVNSLARIDFERILRQVAELSRSTNAAVAFSA